MDYDPTLQTFTANDSGPATNLPQVNRINPGIAAMAAQQMPQLRSRAMVNTGDGSGGPGMAGLPSSIYVQMPDGTQVPVPVSAADFTGNANPQLASALMAGGKPIDPSTGQPLYSTGDVYGGQLWSQTPGTTGVPLQVALGGQWLGAPAPGQGSQQDVYNQYLKTGQPPQLTQLQAQAWDPNYANQSPAAGGGQKPTGPGYTGGPNYATTSTDLNGLLTSGVSGGGSPNYIDDINLPAPPQIQYGFDPAAMAQYNQQNATAVNGLGGFYDYTTPQMTPAQMNMGAVPQATAQTPQSFDALNFLLSGQGFDPSTIAKMKAQSGDAISKEEAAQMSTGKLAAEQTGMTPDSGANLALQSQIARSAGDARTAAQNQIDIQNAQQGIQNLTTGAGMELNRQTTADQMANQVALQNAANELSAMQTNVANTQMANQFNTGNAFQQQQDRANAQANMASGIGQNTAAAQLAKYAGAETQNAQNTMATNMNNAELQRQRQLANSQIGENRYSQALGGMLGLAGSANPSGYYGQSAQIGSGYQPNMVLPNFASNISSTWTSPQQVNRVAGSTVG